MITPHLSSTPDISAGEISGPTINNSDRAGSARRTGGSLLVALALTAGAVLGTGVAPAAAGSTSAAAGVVDGSSERVFTDDISAARRNQGLPLLATRGDLVVVARRWATTMAQRDVLAHNPSLTKQVQDWSWVGENVGYGPDAQVVHVAFMDSPGHRANILDTDYTQVGVGAVVLNGRVWVAEVFRKPSRSPARTKPVTTRANATTSVTTKAVGFSRVLVPGLQGADISRVQRRLDVTVTGRYNEVTRRAVSRFQKSLGWQGRGNVGRGTWARLF